MSAPDLLLPDYGLTIRQPWASAFLYGTPPKAVENRVETSSVVPQALDLLAAGAAPLVAIHAGKASGPEQRGHLAQLFDAGLMPHNDFDSLPLGVVIAVGKLWRVEEPSGLNYALTPWRVPTQYGLWFREVQAVDHHIRCGQLGLWKWPTWTKLRPKGAR